MKLILANVTMTTIIIIHRFYCDNKTHTHTQMYKFIIIFLNS
jgi:hypothetical protein